MGNKQNNATMRYSLLRLKAEADEVTLAATIAKMAAPYPRRNIMMHDELNL